MKTKQRSRFLAAILFTLILFVLAESDTDPLEVLALQDLYKSLNSPHHLRGWKLEGGDPCGEVWMGISCSGSSVVDLQIRGLKLLGTLGNHLQDLHNLKNLDVSFNNLQGEIPYGLPPNATHLNMAYNNLTQSIPFSLPLMTSLQALNLSHNSLYGPLGNVFTGLQIKEMDLSFNNLTGDLPSSFGSLMKLTSLYLQNNRFTGSVIYLEDLPLTDLNIEDNEFSGIIPSHFQSIPHLRIWGNKFKVEANSKPWKFLLQAVVVVVSVLLGGFFATQNTRFNWRLPLSLMKVFSAEGIQLATNNFSLLLSLTKVFSAEEIQLATNNFSEENLLGKGPLGSVYRAKLPDGQVAAVRKIPMSSLSLHDMEQFAEMLETASELKHPNVVTLLGCCVENELVCVVHEFVINVSMYNNNLSFGMILKMDAGVPQALEEVGHLSLYSAIHEQLYQPLSWKSRLRIAIGVARALENFHSSFGYPIAHSDLKATNILLDEKLTPRIADCGLAGLRPLTSNSVKLGASEIEIQNTGYIAPEHGESGSSGIKSDVYALGVLLLELLTGRKAFDSPRPRGEQLLVRWASTRLQDRQSVEQMIDQVIAGTFSSRVTTQYADIISLCTQSVETRPPVSEILEALTELRQ